MQNSMIHFPVALDQNMMMTSTFDDKIRSFPFNLSPKVIHTAFPAYIPHTPACYHSSHPYSPPFSPSTSCTLRFIVISTSHSCAGFPTLKSYLNFFITYIYLLRDLIFFSGYHTVSY